MKAKLQIDAPAIGDAVAQFYYVYVTIPFNIRSIGGLSSEILA